MVIIDSQNSCNFFFFAVPPKIVPFSFQEEIIKGNLARVSCIVSRGDLPLNITWTKDGQPSSIIPGITVRMFDDFSSIMSIDSASTQHSGTYTCTAANAAGIVASSASLR